jgi:large subunit ribosomal protein L22
MSQSVAHAHFARYSHRKVGQVLGLIRGKSVVEAMGLLPWVPRISRVLVEKTLKSAAANAGKSVGPDQLWVAEAWVNHGPALRRVMPKAMGARAMFKRKTCHLTIVVSDQKPKNKD